jgi:hypothetical protein
VLTSTSSAAATPPASAECRNDLLLICPLLCADDQ